MSLKTDLKSLIQKYDLKPNKLLGQNFLIDQNVLKKIIAAADLSKNDTVLEIGPGLGTLTEALAREAERVIAIEKDKKMAEVVKNVLSDRNIRNVEIVEGDILKIPNTKYQTQKYKVVANIPYYLTARLIRKFLEIEDPPSEMILMIQKEVAQRICARPPSLRSGASGQAKPPKMSLLAVSVQFYAEPKIIDYVSKKSFWPAPKVDSAILKITPYATPICGFHTDNTDKEICVSASELPEPEGRRRAFRVLFFKVVRAGFSHPRKQLIGNLSSGLKINREKISQVLKKIGTAPEQRAESLNVEDWKKLTEILNHEA